MQPVDRQRIGEHVPVATIAHTTIQLLLETVSFTGYVQVVIRKSVGAKTEVFMCAVVAVIFEE
jgi:hypothetical protein